MSKYDKFWEANEKSGNIFQEMHLKFGRWGEFSIDNADTLLLISRLENVSPELLAITWANESSFRFYCEPNMNNQPDNFRAWDVGPMQLNVDYTLKDIEVRFFSDKEIDVSQAFGNRFGNVLFNGDPIQNLRLGVRKLKALGRADVVGKDKKILMPKVSINVWNGLDEYTKSIRRAALYTRPDARDARIASYTKFAPMFKKFFEVYSKETT